MTYGASECHAGLKAMLETRPLNDDELASDGLGVQGSPYIIRRNHDNLRAAMASMPKDALAEAMAGILIARFGRVRAGLIARDVARIAEGGK